MTNEEAINVLKNTAWLGTEKDRERVEKAVELAVEALENEIPHTCNYCEHYQGVHGVQGHAPCKFFHVGGVLYNDYCSNWRRYNG